MAEDRERAAVLARRVTVGIVTALPEEREGPRPAPTRAFLRRLLTAVLRSDADLDAFCLDYFSAVHARFTSGMDRVQKVSLLIEHTDPLEVIDRLRDRDAPAVAKHADLLDLAPAGSHDAKSTPQTPNNLRARNPYFRGRGEELADLEAVLGSGGKATITHASVFGLGGVGKTALALELAHRAVDRGAYPGGVWWVAAEGKPVDALVAFAPVLRARLPEDLRRGLPEAETRAEVIAEEVRLALQEQKAASLLVLDNVSEPWGQYIPGGAVRVLVTTRDANLAIGEVRKLEVLSKEHAREVADAIAGEPRDKAEGEARDRVVVSELGGLAVAVEMAARAVKKWFNGLWTSYEQMLHREMEKVLDARKLYADYGRGVFNAIDLSIDRCDEEARMLLEGAAVLAPEAMPKEWALGAAGIEADSLPDVRATAALKELGLITVDENKGVVSMHRLVHRRVRARAQAEHKEVWDEVARRGVTCVATWIDSMVKFDYVVREQMEAVDARREHVDHALSMAERVGSDAGRTLIIERLRLYLDRSALLDFFESAKAIAHSRGGTVRLEMITWG